MQVFFKQKVPVPGISPAATLGMKWAEQACSWSRLVPSLFCICNKPIPGILKSAKKPERTFRDKSMHYDLARLLHS